MNSRKATVPGASSVARAALLLCVLSGTSHAATNGLKINPGNVSFGNCVVGAAGATHTVTVTNGSRQSIKIESVSLSSLQFAYSGPPLPVTLSPGHSFSGTVLFLPTAAQNYSARLTFSLRQSWFGSATAQLSGTGTAAPVSASSPSTPPPAAPKATPTITWAAPAAISYGTALSGIQLSASASTPGSFAYNPAPGTVLNAGNRTLSVLFTPADPANYNTATSSVVLAVNKVTPTITWATPAAIASGTALSAAQLDATASTAGSFVYTPALGTLLSAGSHTLSVTFVPVDPADYNTAAGSVAVLVNSATPATGTLSVNPASATFGNVSVGSNSSQTISLTNTGSGSVTISNVNISAPGVSATGMPAGMVLAGGQSASLNVTFAASSTGSVTGNVTIASNASDSSLTIPVSATGVSHSVSLSWGAESTATGGYHVYSSTLSGGPYNRLTPAPVTSSTFSDGSVQPGLTYYYVVTSIDAATNLESSYSNQAAVAIP